METASLDQYLQTDQSFLACYARVLVAIAQHDKSVSLAEFAELMEVAHSAQYSALMGMHILHGLEHGVNWETALAALGNCARQDTEAQQAFKIALPLLHLQADQARPLARRLAQALNITLNPANLEGLPEEAKLGLMQNLAHKAKKMFRREEMADVVLDLGRDFGDREMIEQAQSCQRGVLSEQQLNVQLNLAINKASQNIIQLKQVLSSSSHVAMAATASALPARPQHLAATPALSQLEAAQQLQEQVKQRLSIIVARIAFEKKAFAEDIEDLIYDAGNAIENSMNERLQTDQWKDKDVWQSMAKSQFGIQAERRITRAVQRREEILRLFKEELRLFQADIQVVQASLQGRQQQRALAELMPPLRLGTRFVNAMDTAANVTIGASSVAVAGTGAAVYMLGSAAVLPLIAPAAPILLGALAAAGLFKWFTDNDKRKIAEIAAKRKAIEEVVGKQLHEAYHSFETQLDELENHLFLTASMLLEPMLFDAHAAEQVQKRHAEMAMRIIEQTETTIQKLSIELQ